MEQGVRLIDLMNSLLKIVKDREELLFDMLAFVSKNIDSSSIDLDHTNTINRLLPPLRAKHQILVAREKELLGLLSEGCEQELSAKAASKEMIRFSSRVMELLEASINRLRKGIFDENGRSDREYVRFKLNLHRILKKQPFACLEFAESIVAYVAAKFQRQLAKIDKYLQKTWEGEDILLRELYMKGSDLDASSSPDDKLESKDKKHQPLLKQKQLKLNINSHNNQEDKKVRRPLKSSVKRKQKPTVRKKQKESPRLEQQSQQQMCVRVGVGRQGVAAKLLKFYGVLQLNRKQFLQDYMYEQIQQQRHKHELMSKLLERNKPINTQINTYIRRSATQITVPLIIMPPPHISSGEERSDRNQSLGLKLNPRGRFVITTRRGSFHADTSLMEPHSERAPDLEFQHTPAHLTPARKRTSHSTQKPQEKSRKLYIVKQQMVFQDEIIPQAQMTKTQWLHTPITLKKDRRNQNLRLKRKHNPTPLENATLAQNFRYPP